MPTITTTAAHAKDFIRDKVFDIGFRSEYDRLRVVIIAYLVVLLLVTVILTFVFRYKPWPAFTTGLVVSQLFLNVLYMPTSVSFWSDFNSYVALYNLIQCGTPLFIYAYLIVTNWSSRCSKRDIYDDDQQQMLLYHRRRKQILTKRRMSTGK